MKKMSKVDKLLLRRETLRRLDALESGDLAKAQGGGITTVTITTETTATTNSSWGSTIITTITITA